MSRLLLVGVCLVGCGPGSYVTPQANGAVGLGLTAGFGVAHEVCDSGLFTEEYCYEQAETLRAARATSDHATLVTLGDSSARFHAEREGIATAVISSYDEQFDIEFEIRAIEIDRLEPTADYLDEVFTRDSLAYFTRSEPWFRHITQYYDRHETGDVSVRALRGEASFSITGDTESSVEQSYALAEVSTGNVPGIAKLVASTGSVLVLEIVEASEISELQIYDREQRVSSVIVDDYGLLQILPLLSPTRPIVGCSGEAPRVTVEPPVVTASTTCRDHHFLDLERTAPGPATVTVAWGGATTSFAIVER